jgi:hypothetical protein
MKNKLFCKEINSDKLIKCRKYDTHAQSDVCTKWKEDIINLTTETTRAFLVQGIKIRER